MYGQNCWRLPRECLHGRENPSRERERADVPSRAQDVPGRVAGAPRSDATEGSSANNAIVPGKIATHGYNMPATSPESFTDPDRFATNDQALDWQVVVTYLLASAQRGRESEVSEVQ